MSYIELDLTPDALDKLQGTMEYFRSKVGFVKYLAAYLSSYQEKAIKAALLRTRLGLAAVYHTEMGKSCKVPFPTAHRKTCQLVLHILPLMLSIKQGSYEHQF